MNNIINVEESFDKIFEFVSNILSTIKIDTTDLQHLSSILQLFYSLANYNDYKPAELFIPIFNELPNILRLSQFDTSIFNVFCTNVRFTHAIFESSYEAYFELFIEILSNPDFSSLKNASSIALGYLITTLPLYFLKSATDIFDILAQTMDQNEISYEIADLSNEYGENAFFAEHVYDYLKNNAPDPNAYIAFGSAFLGMKSHFIDSNLSEELLSLFEPGFTSQDSFTRFVSFNSFKIIISNIVDNDEWCQCSQSILEVAFNVITNEDNEESLLKEIQLLSELLKKFSLNYSEIIEDIISLLDQLTEICTPIEYQNELFQCYKYIASSYKEQFLPFSQNFGSKMMYYIDNPLEDEDLFFNCIDILSDFNESFPEDFFNGLLQSSIQFLTSVVCNENGNVNEEYSLSDDYLLRIINFFLSCLQKNIIDDSFELIETIIKISFNTASKGIVSELVDRNSDLGFVTKCHILICSQGYLLIGKEQFILIQNSIKILVLIFKSNEQLLQQYNEHIIKLTNILLKESSFTCNPILHDIYELIKFDFMFNSDEDDLLNALYLSLSITLNKSNLGYDKYDYGHYSECLIDLVKIIGNRFGDDLSEHTIPFIQELLNILNYVFNNLDRFSEICRLKSEAFQNEKYYHNHEKAKIDIALAYREFFKSFPLIATLIFSKIASFIIEHDNNKIRSIVFSDFIYFCPQEDDSAFISTLQYFYGKLGDIDILFDSLYALAIIFVPQRFSEELMSSFVIGLSSNLANARNDIKNIILFFLLQVFQNYLSFFDIYDQFWELFDDDICSLPYYCYFYLDQSLTFLVENFQNQIPDEKESTLQSAIQKIKEKL